MPRVIAELLRGSPMSPGKVEFAWKAAVGPADGSRHVPVRLEGRTLLVDANTAAWGREVTRSSRLILRRMQTLLGRRDREVRLRETNGRPCR